MTDRELMQQALEALKKCRYRSLADEIVDPAITALRSRLAQPEQEPVAYIEHHKGGDNLVWDDPGGKRSPLYTAPPQRKPLKLREIEKCIYDANNDPIVACRNVEAAHGIKGGA